MDLNSLVPWLASLLGLTPTTLIAAIGFLVTLANATARLIPNDATGWLGTARQVASILGVYISSRVTAGTTVNDAAALVVSNAPASADPPAAATIGKPLVSLILAMILLPLALALAACATTGQVTASQDFAYAQLGFKSIQQAAIACISTAPVATCVANKDAIIAAIDKGQVAETAGYTAQQSLNQPALTQAATDLGAAIAALQSLGVTP